MAGMRLATWAPLVGQDLLPHNLKRLRTSQAYG